MFNVFNGTPLAAYNTDTSILIQGDSLTLLEDEP